VTELRNMEHELGRFRLRLVAAAVFVLVGFGLLAMRLVHLQVLKHDELATQAEANRVAVVPMVPNRGLIIDRNGVVLASNYSAYTLELMPAQLDNLDATIDEVSQVVEVTARDRRRFKRLLEESKNIESVPLRTRLSDEEVARFIAQRYRFPGVEIKARLFRSYPYGELASHVLGYIGRINQAEKQNIEEWPEEQQANYRGTEYIGKLGIEQKYESELHGITGFEQIETSAGGRLVRRLHANPGTAGHTVRLAIDIKLQALIEDMYGARRGALVAIDPRSGEVLAFVSKPTFDPNLFVDGIDADSWKELNDSADKPLLNRALRGTYPPGSTYKPFLAMAALSTGTRSATQTIVDNGVFLFGNHRFRSHGDGGLGLVDMTRSIVQSSNVYYYSLANDLGVDMIHDQLEPYGFGRSTGIDLDGEVTGDLPSTEWKRRKFKRPDQQKWYAGETISLGIGQGYNNFTMLQVATALSTLVSGGQRFQPRLVREIEDIITRERRQISAQALSPLDLKPDHLNVIRRALYGVTQEGTSARVFAGAAYRSGGKTGTAQAVGIRQNEKYNKDRLDEYLRDHSLYIAFAPLEEPRVAVAVIVENAGFGAAAAAPIARRVLDYLLADQYPSPEDLDLVRLGQAGPPVGKPRRVADVGLPMGQGSMAALASPALPAGPLPPQAVPVSTPGPAPGGATGPAPAASAPPLLPPAAQAPTGAPPPAARRPLTEAAAAAAAEFAP
jgi:penicillin-binding protein 2